MANSKEIQLGQLLVQKRQCTLQQVNEGLRIQRELRGARKYKPLGRILVDNGFLAEANLRLALFEMRVLRLYCAECDVSFVPETFQAGVEITCPVCKGSTVCDDRQPEAVQASRTSRSDTVRSTSSPGASRPAASGSGSLKASQPETCVGKILGGCEIVSKIAHGGMGVVYKAVQLNLGRTVAVKILAEELASDESFVRRFVQEARAAAQLNHGNIVHINDVGEYQGIYYFVMEYVEGENLRQILKRERSLSVGRAFEIAAQVCLALRHAHNRGIIHRDIKPENIMMTPEGSVKLADLGLAKRVGAEPRAGVTHAGSILGTPYYMAPEQAKDFSKVDWRSDIYSLGVTLYRMIAGTVPYRGRSPIEVMIKAIEGRKKPISHFDKDVPVAVEEVVDKMMHRRPEERYQDIDQALQAVQRVSSMLAVSERAT